VTHVEQRNDTTARQRSTLGDDGRGTCKRPARLDGRLSGDGGSARRRKQAAGNQTNTKLTSSFQPQLEGQFHSKVKGLARLTSGSKKQWQDGGEEGAVEQRKKTGGSA
jgi:hypothetical protein